ncbi:MAG: hypothetical protein IPM63_15335 [Acidobacteriota bacterium]|nr:MAG: hypothetical protein IPM63_15335 [Acidobacteriota bacterium]
MKNLFLFFAMLFASVVSSYAHPAWGIEVDRHRNVYFADISHNGMGTVWKLSAKGELTALLKDFHAHNVNLDKNGLPVAAHGEEGNNLFIRVLPDSTTETIIREADWDRFFGGNAFYSKRGNIYFAMKGIWQIKPGGERIRFNDHEFKWIQSMYVDDEEFVYAVDKAVDNGTLYRLSGNGSVEVLASGLITKTSEPVDLHDVTLLGITKGCEGRIYVTESVGRRVVRIESGKTFTTVYRSAENWFPTGVDMFAGDLYVLEYGRKENNKGPRISRIDESGRVSILFELGSGIGARNAIEVR